jgi:hypothetical protein
LVSQQQDFEILCAVRLAARRDQIEEQVHQVRHG